MNGFRFRYVSIVASSLLGWGIVSSGAEESFDFRYRISPILAKVGCSAAECHGGATGQGGFKLSLFAENPQLDYQAIVEELEGRRLDLDAPDRSLFLRKPTRSGVKHKGGRLFHPDDQLYQLLRQWIANGAPLQAGPEVNLVDLSLEADGNRYRAWARFQTGDREAVEDVTHLALLESTNEQVATIDESGVTHQTGSGETWLLARYGHLNARTAIHFPFENPSWAGAGNTEHPLDRAWTQRLQSLGLTSAPRANPNTLARRLYLDLVGRPPEPSELDAFLALPERERVPRTAEILLASDAFSEVFGRHVAAFFEVPVAGKDPRNASQRNTELRAFFLQAVRDEASLFEVANQVLLDPTGQKAWRHYADPRDRAEFVGRSLLGIRIGCARCHNHPLDRWTNEEHLSFSAFFTDPRPGPNGMMMDGKFFLPGTGDSIEPELLPVSLASPPQQLNNEETVSWMITQGARDQFARNMGNRLFNVLMGHSLVDLPDDHRLTNPAVHEPMLAVLERTFLEQGGDLRAFVTFLVGSTHYAMSSAPPQKESVSGDPELQYLARREARPLTPEELSAAVEFVLGVPLEAATPPESPLARQLFLLNSGMLDEGIGREGNQIDALLLFEVEAEDQLRELYRLVLAREPRADEMKTLLPLLEQSTNRETAVKDLAFALLASREFGSVR